MSPTALLVPTLSQMLRALVNWLDKAEAAQADMAGLLDARLAPDMLPLAAQLRFVCVQAREAIGHLRGEGEASDLAALRAEGLGAGSGAGTIADARSRIAETLAMLDALAPDALDGGQDAPVTLQMPNGIVFDMTGGEYVRDWLLPQFYFHLNTAYAILRHRGIALGKPDYVPHMRAYIRPGTVPGA